MTLGDEVVGVVKPAPDHRLLDGSTLNQQFNPASSFETANLANPIR